MDAPFAPATLFDLSGFAHASLFDGRTHAWEVLSVLGEYVRDTMRAGVRGRVEDGAFVSGDVEIAEDALVEAGAYVKGPAIIGPGAEVRHGAYVRGNVLAGARAVIGHTTEAKNSVFLDDAKAPHFAYVGDSVLGNRVNLGAGTKLANLKVVEGNVAVSVPGGGRLDSGLRKFGAIVGDDVEIGCNTVSAPGTVVGPRTLVYSVTSLSGTIPADSIVAFKPDLSVRTRRRR